MCGIRNKKGNLRATVNFLPSWRIGRKWPHSSLRKLQFRSSRHFQCKISSEAAEVLLRTETEKSFTAIRARGLSLWKLSSTNSAFEEGTIRSTRMKRSTKAAGWGLDFFGTNPNSFKRRNFHFKERGCLLQLIRIHIPLFSCMLHPFNYSLLGARKTFFVTENVIPQIIWILEFSTCAYTFLGKCLAHTST